ncbi:unnamed protein product [Spirodela intermedia]|uniref:Co-chaperone protein p23 n=1 Tax=Spirodela intermedia TaxID=51605 RepID=A0A7I8JG01_SPIIN|nr:unnamed protein product [Spirodela intermedia]CAA6669098.1 unnamed protein product [Spirodela intermedia]
MCRHPEVKWAERVDKVFITILLPDAKAVKIHLEPEGALIFSANAGAENHLYELKLDLHDKVNVEESKINIGVRNIFCVVEKVEKTWWSKLLRGDAKPPHYIKVDWDKWVDEDEDAGDLDFGGMDFSKFGDMGGAGEGHDHGLDHSHALDDDDLEDSDEDDHEAEKIEPAGEKSGEEASKA